ncbi:Peroxiredoxin-like 2A [Bulinus truncatus]|nr:Peroxiredoxin-like 2A [Bulinus truncatus]
MLILNDLIWWFSCFETMGAFTKLGVIGAVAVVGVGILCNLPVNPFVKTPEKATLDYLAQTKLKTFGSDSKEFLASELWQKNGAVIMAEAKQLSSLKPQLEAHSIPLYAVVHENLGVAEFQPFFSGEIFLDKDRRFYGPVERTMLFSGLLRVNVIRKILETKNRGIEGNMQGEGRILGGVFVIGSGDKGILFEHREKEFGDYANLTEVLTAALQIRPNKNNIHDDDTADFKSTSLWLMDKKKCD